MKKSDLKQFDILEFSTGEKAVYYDDGFTYIKNGDFTNRFDEIKDCTFIEKESRLDWGYPLLIKKVYRIKPIPQPLRFLFKKEKHTLIYERKEVKEVTMEELEQHFGCKVKVVK